MVVVLVHWLIRKDAEPEFENWWNAMPVEPHKGLFHETLTRIHSEPNNPKFHTFSIGDPFYTTYLNVGFWESVDHFDKALGTRIAAAERSVDSEGKVKLVITMEPFEFKLRERTVLEVIEHRGDKAIR